MAFKGKKTPVQADKSAGSEFVQRFKQNPLVFAGTLFVLVIVVVAFVLVPAIVPGVGQMADLTFGHYGKIPISYVPGNYLAQYYEWAAQYYRNFGDIYSNMFIEQRIWRESFEAAAFRIAVLQEVKKSGYTVPVKTVDKEVAQRFMVDGRFSSALYNRYDNNARLAMWQMSMDDITFRRYQTDMEGLVNPSQAGQFIAKMASPLRSFDLVNFSINAYPDSEIALYAEQNAELFRQSHLSRITVFSSEREARQILRSIEEGTTTFEDAARAHSQDQYSERGGDMGSKTVHELITEIPVEAEREKILALGTDELSGVIKIDNSWVIFRVIDKVHPFDIADDTALSRVRSYIEMFERGRMEDWAEAEARKFISAVNEKGFDAAVREFELNKQSFGPIPLNFGDTELFESLSSASIPELSGSSSDENFWKTAFGTEINTVSEPLVQGSNIIVLYPVSEEEADETVIENILSNYNNYWLSNTSGASMRSYFLNSSKMDDRFIETFLRYLMPQN